MNETEYLKSRIKDLEKIVNNPGIPLNIRLNQQRALINYKAELSNLTRQSF